MTTLREQELLRRITLNPRVLCGKPTIRGMRISVEQIVRAVAGGVPEADLLDDFPDLEPDDIRAAVLYAALTVAHEDVFALATVER